MPLPSRQPGLAALWRRMGLRFGIAAAILAAVGEGLQKLFAFGVPGLPSAILAVNALILWCILRQFLNQLEPQAAPHLEKEEAPPAPVLDLAKIREQAQFEAIARTTQILAHNLRKPFSLLRMGLSLLDAESLPPRGRELLARLMPQVDDAMHQANILIQDIMEAGTTSRPAFEPVSPRQLIAETLRKRFRSRAKADVRLDIALTHSHMIPGDPVRLERCLRQIIENALEYTPAQGAIQIATRDAGEAAQPWLEFIISNTGEPLPEDTRAKVFSPFFSGQAQSRAGLGLTLARNVVVAHGGTITLETVDGSDRTEIKVRLPALAEQTDRALVSLPKTWHQPPPSDVVGDDDACDGGLAEKAASASYEATKKPLPAAEPLKVVVVEDEGIYRDALSAMIHQYHVHEQQEIELLVLAEGHNAAARASAFNPDLIICDVDLGHDDIDGFDVIAGLRARGCPAVVCMHTNRGLPGDKERGSKVGADSYIAKPMASSDLCELLDAAYERRVHERPAGAMTKLAPAESAKTASRPVVAVVDDDIFVLEAWEQALGQDVLVHSFPDPDAFLALCERDPAFAAKLDLVICDFYFGDDSSLNGKDVSIRLKSQHPVPILLCSDAAFSRSELGSFDGVIAKQPMPYAMVRGALGCFNTI